MQALKAVVKANADWVPDRDGTALYIRPFVIAMDPFLGVRPADWYRFMIICSPVGAYYPEGINPVKIFIEDEYVRAVKGGHRRGQNRRQLCGQYEVSGQGP